MAIAGVPAARFWLAFLMLVAVLALVGLIHTLQGPARGPASTS